MSDPVHARGRSGDRRIRRCAPGPRQDARTKSGGRGSMTEVWITIGVLVVTTALIRASGPVLLGGRDMPASVQSVIALVAPALLAALVVVETLSAPEGNSLEL